MDDTRPTWVFRCGASPCFAVGNVDTSGDKLRYGKALVSPSDATSYPFTEKYAGSLLLEVSADACGLFVFDILDSPVSTDLRDEFAISITPLVTEDLTIEVTSPGAPTGQCDCRNIIASNPPNCTIDARQPTTPDGSVVQTMDSVTLTFDCSDTTPIASASLFVMSRTPGGVAFIDSLTPSGSDLTVTLTAPYQEKKWTCVEFVGPNSDGDKICVGIMPGDDNTDAESLLSDISFLQDCLTGATPSPCTLFQCDDNRDGVCGPHDLLRKIDLLGPDVFATYLGQGITNFAGVVTCPSAGP